VKKKLDNPDFQKNAPPEVVEKDKGRVGELTDKIARLNENLQRLEPEAEVRIAAPAAGPVDLAKELKDAVANVRVPPEVDPQVKDALHKLREGTKTGLSPQDHRDLGVAYMNMGLVDDAVREFSAAKGDEKKKAKAKAKAKKPAKKAKGAKKVKAKASAKKSRSGPKKKPAKKSRR
jgi:valyl-tRNA synthetase